MKTRDAFMIATRDAVRSRAKTFFTFLNVTVLSCLLMGIVYVTVLANTSLKATLVKAISDSGFYVGCQSEAGITQEDYSRMRELYRELPQEKTTITARVSNNYLIDFSHTSLCTTTGSVNPAYHDQPYVYISPVFSDYYKEGMAFSIEYKGENGTETMSLIIAGYIEGLPSNSHYIDIDFYQHSIAPLTSFEVYCKGTTGLMSEETIEKVREFYHEMKELFPDSFANGEKIARLEAFDKLPSVRRESVMIAVCLALVILAMSIGTISSSVVMTIDENREFYGMMRLLGSEKNAVFKILSIELVEDITSGVILATVLLLLLTPALSRLSLVMSSLMASYSLNIGSSVTAATRSAYPWYLPIGTIIVTFGFVMIFSRKKLWQALGEIPLIAQG